MINKDKSTYLLWFVAAVVFSVFLTVIGQVYRPSEPTDSRNIRTLVQYIY